MASLQTGSRAVSDAGPRPKFQGENTVDATFAAKLNDHDEKHRRQIPLEQLERDPTYTFQTLLSQEERRALVWSIQDDSAIELRVQFEKKTHKSEQLRALLDEYNTFGKPAEDYVESTCLVCCDTYASYNLISLQCEHKYCRDCLTTYFSACLTNEALYPVMCCQNPIPLNLPGTFLSTHIKQAYTAKAEEFSRGKRLYCSKPTCSAFLKVDNNVIGSRIICPKCNTQTCHRCRSRAHQTQTCPDRLGEKKLFDVASRKRWKQCPECKQMIERAVGCNHMICSCGASFCYICGKPWHLCEDLGLHISAQTTRELPLRPYPLRRQARTRRTVEDPEYSTSDHDDGAEKENENQGAPASASSGPQGPGRRTVEALASAAGSSSALGPSSAAASATDADASGSGRGGRGRLFGVRDLRRRRGGGGGGEGALGDGVDEQGDGEGGTGGKKGSTGCVVG